MTREWLAWPDLGALAPEHVFAAGALTATVVQCAIVACAGRLARRRKRALAFPPDDPRRIWGELKELRAECAASTSNLETMVAQLKDRTEAHLADRSSSAEELRRLQDAVDQGASRIDTLERQVVALELVKARHELELQRKNEELASGADALARAEQTIALLRGMVDVPGLARPRVPSRASR